MQENEELKNKVLELEKEVRRLKRELAKCKKVNSRGAGRKPKFDDLEVETMKLMKARGDSYNQIATHFKTTKTTIIKYLVHRDS